MTMKPLAAVLQVLLLALPCACSTMPAPSGVVAAGADPAHVIVVTVRNEAHAYAEHPGSTPRGYDAVERYQVTGGASRRLHALEHDYGLREIAAWPIASLHLHCIMFELPPAMARDRMIAQLARDGRVESVQPLNEFATQSGAMSDPWAEAAAADPAQAMPYNDPYVRLQHALRELDIVQAQRYGRGAGVRIAVIDTGVDFEHPDLGQRVMARANFVDADEQRFVRDIHGTEVAGVIAAVAGNGIGIVGIAPEARIIALKACWQVAAEAHAVCNSFTLAQALEAAIAAQADIVNLSLAGPLDPLLTRLVEQGSARGMLFVGAAASAPGASFPADLDEVLAVDAAEDATGNRRHIRAPGRSVLTLLPAGHYDFASGSSLAAAEVSGVLALLLNEHPHLSGGQAREILLRSSRHLPAPQGMLTTIDACTALALLQDGVRCDGPAVAASELSSPADR
jgi:hypothetical protein